MITRYIHEPAVIIENTPEAYSEFGRDAVGWCEYRLDRKDVESLLEGRCLALIVGDVHAAFVYVDQEREEKK